MQFSELQSRVADNLDRDDLTTRIKDWINDTRLDIALKYNFNYLYVEATTETSAGSGRYAFPTDYLGHETVFLESKKLVRIGARELDEQDGTDYDLTNDSNITAYLTTTGSQRQDEPDYYVDRGMEFQLYPTPDTNYTVTIKYYAQPSEFTADTEEDYISRFHYEAIIWGACLRGAIYLDDEVKINMFNPLYQAAVTEMLRKEQDKKKVDKRVRMKTWRDYPLVQWNRLTKFTPYY